LGYLRNLLHARQPAPKHFDLARLVLDLYVLSRGLRHQIFLGSDGFIDQVTRSSRTGAALREVPRAQRRPLVKALTHFEERFADRREAMARAFQTGVYRLPPWAAHSRRGKGASTLTDLM
jgi:hypothetical protein